MRRRSYYNLHRAPSCLIVLQLLVVNCHLSIISERSNNSDSDESVFLLSLVYVLLRECESKLTVGGNRKSLHSTETFHMTWGNQGSRSGPLNFITSDSEIHVISVLLTCAPWIIVLQEKPQTNSLHSTPQWTLVKPRSSYQLPYRHPTSSANHVRQPYRHAP